MNTKTFTMGGRIAVAGMVALLSLGIGTGRAGAGTPVACTIEMDPTEIFINAQDTTAAAGELTSTYTGSWSLGDNVYAWISVNDGAPVYDGGGPRDQEQVFTFPFTAAGIVDLIAQGLGSEPAYGEYTVRLELHYVRTELLSLPAGVAPPYDVEDLLCVEEFYVTWSESELPETGTDVVTMWTWTAALLGLGTVSVLVASRRRA